MLWDALQPITGCTVVGSAGSAANSNSFKTAIYTDGSCSAQLCSDTQCQECASSSIIYSSQGCVPSSPSATTYATVSCPTSTQPYASSISTATSTIGSTSGNSDSCSQSQAQCNAHCAGAQQVFSCSEDGGFAQSSCECIHNSGAEIDLKPIFVYLSLVTMLLTL